VTILNPDATFECTFGRGCDGVCCRNGRPPAYPEDIARIDPHLARFIPALRPKARVVVERDGYLSNRRKAGERALRVADGWCVFFNDGCVLHRVGAEEGDSFRYKPFFCAVFPLDKDRKGRWYIRQKGFNRETWDLPCLDPAATQRRAVDVLLEEIALAGAPARFDSRPT